MIENYQKIEVAEIFDTLGENLSITESQHNAAVASYKAVGNWLTAENSELQPYNPVVSPQGSFLLGTIIQSVDPDGDIDLDIVCELNGKKLSWTQKDLKEIIGKQLRLHKTLNSLLDEEGRRCWTLQYRENGTANEKYHMDILPAVSTKGHSIISEKVFGDLMNQKDEDLLLSITDKEQGPCYYMTTEPRLWPQSNPFGYAKWFFKRASEIGGERSKIFALKESVNPTPKFQKERLPLQRVVQLLKRHRDLMFQDYDEDDKKEKPISCIITTLAGKAYQGENNVFDAFINIVFNLRKHILDYNPHTGREEKWVMNPVNETENFADRWTLPGSQREKFFYMWLDKLKSDFEYLKFPINRVVMAQSLSKAFGSEPVRKTFSDIADRKKILTASGKNFVDKEIGLLGLTDRDKSNIIKINKHKFFGTQ